MNKIKELAERLMKMPESLKLLESLKKVQNVLDKLDEWKNGNSKIDV